jgi:hypothetical protein
MLKTLTAISLAFMVACGATKPAVQYPGIPEGPRRVEATPLPPLPNKDPLAEDQNYSIPLLEGDKSPKDGILLSPEKVDRVLQLDLSYDELRKLYAYDKTIWQQQRIFYEESLGQANNQIIKLTPDWWSENKLPLGVVTGFVLGTLATIGIVYGINQVN